MRNCIWSFALLFVAAPGCGDDDSTPDDAGRDDATEVADEAGADGDADGDADAEVADEGGGGTGTLTILVTALDPATEDGVPTAGVTVAADLPGGGRVEQTTGSDGRTTFEELDWAAGTAAATGWLDGYGLVSRVGITEEDGEIELSLGLPLADDPERVELTGVAQNMADAEHHSLIVSGTTDGESFWSDAPGPDWSIQVAPGEPFTLVAVEFAPEPAPCVGCLSMPISGWVVQEQAALSAPATADLDFGTPASATSVTGTFQTVTRGDSPLRTPEYGYVSVFDLESMAIVGTINTTTLGSGGVISFDMEYVEVPAVTRPLTSFRVMGTGDWVSGVLLEGYPTAGTQEFQFLDTPRMIAPATPSARHALHDPLEWELFDSAVTPVLYLTDDELVVWRIRGPEDATTMSVPEAPADADLEALLGTGLVGGRFYFYHRNDTDEFSDHYVQSGLYIFQQ
jgi:hypothetical protein